MVIESLIEICRGYIRNTSTLWRRRLSEKPGNWVVHQVNEGRGRHLKIQKGMKYTVYFGIQSDSAWPKHWAPWGAGTVRDKPRDGLMSVSVDQTVLRTIHGFTSQALTLQPPYPLPQGLPLALKHLAQPTHGKNLTHHSLISFQEVVLTLYYRRQLGAQGS